MAVLPRTLLPLIDFAAAHFAVWEGDPASIGLTAEQVAEYKDVMDAARQAHAAAERARIAAVAATTALRAKVSTLRERSSALVKQIKAYAESVPETPPLAIYAAAQIPPDAQPRTAEPPGTPTDIRLDLVSGGGIRLSWSASNASSATGGVFDILRKLEGPTSPPERGYTWIGSVPGTTREQRRVMYEDKTLPPGAAGASYIITPKRGTRVGEPCQAVTVMLGGTAGPSIGRAKGMGLAA